MDSSSLVTKKYPKAKKLEIIKQFTGSIWDGLNDIKPFYIITNNEDLEKFKDNIPYQIPMIKNKGNVSWQENTYDHILNKKVSFDFDKEVLIIKMFYPIQNIWRDENTVVIESEQYGREDGYTGVVVSLAGGGLSFDDMEHPEAEFEICQKVYNPYPKIKNKKKVIL